MPRQIRRLRCYVGPYSRGPFGGVETWGMVIAYSQRQAQNLLGIGHKRFAEEWNEQEIPKIVYSKFVVYLRGIGPDDIWTERGD